MVLLKKDNCQKIVDRLVDILDQNINIMDLEGKIIASTNKERIGTFHKGASLCLESGKELVITKENQTLYKDCQEGINLPLYYEQDRIGVVGITGEPEEIKKYARIVKELVEMIVLENEQRKYKELRQETVRSFFIQLFNSKNAIDEELLRSRAYMVKFDYQEPKRIVFLEFREIHGATEERPSLEKQKQKNRLIQYINTKIAMNEIVIDLYEDEIILVLNDTNQMSVFLNKLQQELETYYHVGLRLYISERCTDLRAYAKNYENAKKLVELYKRQEKLPQVLWTEDYKLELMLAALTNEEIKDYLLLYRHIFTDEGVKDKSFDDTVETIRIYFENNMSISHTAEQLYIHRNTVKYRLNKFKRVFKVDINKPYECMKLYIGIKLWMKES